MIFLITSGPEFFMGIPSKQVCFQEISLSHLNDGWMDGFMDDAILRHFQHRGDESILTKGYVQWNPVYV